MKTWQQVLLGILIGCLFTGVLFFFITRPANGGIQLIPPPSPAPWMVQVIGAVANPGVYPITQGSRVQDAIKVAGGSLPDADVQGVNLAKLLEDGDRIYIPSKGEYVLSANPTQPISSAPKESTSVPTGQININTASQAELERLPSIGPSKANSIITYRQEHGVFTVVDDLMEVPGIGPGIFDAIKELITVGNIE